MKTISTGEFTELIINKSKFISKAFNINSKKEIELILKELKQKYYDATHICYAYSFYENHVLFEKFSDDNEPNSTAGKPILNVIKKQEINNILVAVVRYFGGVKLGAGGLVRAYTKSAVMALQNAEIEELEIYKKFKVKINYENINTIYNLSNKNLIKILENLDDTFVILVKEKEVEAVNILKNICLEFNEVKE